MALIVTNHNYPNHKHGLVPFAYREHQGKLQGKRS